MLAGPSLQRVVGHDRGKPGAATEVTLLPDGSLERVDASSGERLVHHRQ